MKIAVKVHDVVALAKRFELAPAEAWREVGRCSTVAGRFAWTVFLAMRGPGEWELAETRASLRGAPLGAFRWNSRDARGTGSA